MRGAALLGAALWLAAALAGGGDPAGVRQIPAPEVRAAFERGETLLDGSGYRVNASRRDAPGEAEIHTRDTDIFYLLEGRARFVTGGRIPEPREVEPHELRGARIEGGQERTVAAGEVIVVPPGVAHWFESVESPVVYYVVKVSQ